MCVIEFDTCDCSCHDKDFPGVHVMACCTECHRCRRRISLGFEGQHEKRCKERWDETMRLVRSVRSSFPGTLPAEVTK